MKRSFSRFLALPLCGVAIVGALWILRGEVQVHFARMNVARTSLAERHTDPLGGAPDPKVPSQPAPKRSVTNGRDADPIALFGLIQHRVKSAAARWVRKPGDYLEYQGFPSLEKLHLIELRQWALAFPVEAVEIARDLLRNPGSIGEERNVALQALGVLLQEDHAGAAEELSRAARAQDPSFSAKAIEIIAECGRMDRMSDILVNAAYEGNVTAIRTLGQVGSIENISRLETLIGILEQSPVRGQGGALSDAQLALERARILGGPEGDKVPLDIIDNKDPQHDFWLPWALKVVASHPIEGADRALREYLERAEHREIEFIRNGIGFDPSRNPADELITSIHLSDNQPHYDDVLMMYSRMGGKLSTLQRARLEHFGILGNPRELLQVQLSRKSIWDEK